MGGRRWRGPAATVAVVTVYLLATWLVARPLALVDRTHLPTCACGDVAQEVWLLAVTHASVAHLHLPLSTTSIDYPVGVNLLDNAGFPLLGVLAAPLTAVAGPVAALVVLLRLSFLASALSGFFVLRSVSRTTVAAGIGGGFYAFSPYMTHQAASHFFLVFAPIPPLLLLVVHRQLTGTARLGPARAGALLGALCVAQFLVDNEVLVCTVVAVGLTVALIGVVRVARRRPLRDAAARLGRLLAVAGAVAVPLLAYPAWYALRGPRHVSGPTQGTKGGVDIVSTFLPSDGQLLAWRWAPWRLAVHGFLGHNSFLGVPLVLLAVGITVACRHDPLVRAVALLGSVAWVLQLGAHLQVGTRSTPVPLPFDLLTGLPVLQDIIPNRFSLLVDLSVGVLLAVGADRLLHHIRTGVGAREVAVAVTSLASVALTLPVAGYGAADIGVARDFTTAPGNRLGRATVVLAYPSPAFPDDRAMLWQAVDGMHFALIGGYAIRPGRDGHSIRTPLLPPPAVVDAAFSGRGGGDAHRSAAHRWAAARAALPGYVRDNHVGTIMVELYRPGSERLVVLVSGIYGAPRRLAGLDEWRT